MYEVSALLRARLISQGEKNSLEGTLLWNAGGQAHTSGQPHVAPHLKCIEVLVSMSSWIVVLSPLLDTAPVRWCTLWWVRGWRLMVLVPYSDIVVRGCQCWNSMACPGTCCPGLIFSTAMVCSMTNLGAVSRSGEEVIGPFFPWWLLRWCRRRWIGVSLSHMFILSFQICKIGV
jgi:hypothetical protein